MNPTSKMGTSPRRTPPITSAPLWSSPVTPATLWSRAQPSLSVSMCVTHTGTTRSLCAEVSHYLPRGQSAQGLHPAAQNKAPAWKVWPRYTLVLGCNPFQTNGLLGLVTASSRRNQKMVLLHVGPGSTEHSCCGRGALHGCQLLGAYPASHSTAVHTPINHSRQPGSPEWPSLLIIPRPC